MNTITPDSSRRPHPADIPRRDFLYIATGAAATVGAAATMWPVISSLNPSKDVLALSATEIALSGIEVGQRITIKWRGWPVFIARRTTREISEAKNDDTNPKLIDPATDASRTQRPEWLIVVGVCTHLGCVPLGQSQRAQHGKYGGWFCPCHGSVYDTSGRIRAGPAPRNLDIPPYVFLENDRLRIG